MQTHIVVTQIWAWYWPTEFILYPIRANGFILLCICTPTHHPPPFTHFRATDILECQTLAPNFAPLLHGFSDSLGCVVFAIYFPVRPHAFRIMLAIKSYASAVLQRRVSCKVWEFIFQFWTNMKSGWWCYRRPHSKLNAGAVKKSDHNKEWSWSFQKRIGKYVCSCCNIFQI